MSDYARDIRILDAAPWAEHGPIDQLIALQEAAFGADMRGDLRGVGSIAMQMAAIERSLDNLAEAAAYTDQAAGAFEQAGAVSEALAAKSTLAKEYRTLQSPDLAMSSFLGALDLHGAAAASVTPDQVTFSLRPLLTVMIDLLSSYAGIQVELNAYPQIYIPKRAPHPEQSVVQTTLSASDQLLDRPVLGSNPKLGWEVFLLGAVFSLLADRRLKLPKDEREHAKQRSHLLNQVGAVLMDDESAPFLYSPTGDVTLKTVVASRFEEANRFIVHHRGKKHALVL